jgi:KUP system potassium uptake protein
LRFGFMEDTNAARGLRQAAADGQLQCVDPDAITYCIHRDTVVASQQHPGMSGWRDELFVLMQRNAEETAIHFCVPAKQAWRLEQRSRSEY